MIFEVNGARGTEFFTGSTFSLEEVNAVIGIDRVFERDCLRILHVCRLAVAQAAVIGIGYFLWTLFRARITGNTFVHVDIAGVLGQFDFKVALFAADALHFRKR